MVAALTLVLSMLCLVKEHLENIVISIYMMDSYSEGSTSASLTPLCEIFLVWELHVGGLVGHFGQNKTIEAVESQFYWPSLKRDVARIVAQCHTCDSTKQIK